MTVMKPLESASSPPFIATVTMLNYGICRCDHCGEVMLEDERHWHSGPPTARRSPQNYPETSTIP